MPSAMIWVGLSVYLIVLHNCLCDKVQSFVHKRHSLKTENINRNILKFCSDSWL
jgi:hypothetical protein